MATRSRRKKPRTYRNDADISPIAKDKPPERLQLADVLCCVCRSVLVEPVSLPCHHRFCRCCWLATDALRCPLCRKRVGSWLRESARRNHLVDERLWQIIRDQFPIEIANKLNGVDVDISDDSSVRRLSAPGEIRAEYQEELRRLQAERLQLEQKHSLETERLARKLQEEEEAAHKEYLEKVKRDEELARQLQAAEREQAKLVTRVNGIARNKAPANGTKHTKSRSTIERYLVKQPAEKKFTPKLSPLITEDDEPNNSSSSSKQEAQSSRLPPTYGCFLKDYLDKKLRHLTGSMMDKESTSTVKKWVPPNDSGGSSAQKEFSFGGGKLGIRTKGAQKQLCPDPPLNIAQSVPVSLPYTGILNKNVAALVNESKLKTSSSDSVDSMRQELCYFKPIQATISSSRNINELKEALRVPAVRGTHKQLLHGPQECPPDYLYGLQLLRGKPATYNTPSAFVCLIKLQGDTAKCDISEVKVNPKKTVYKSAIKELPPYSFRRKPIAMKESAKSQKLRRTRSTSNIPKLIQEVTPTKRTPQKALNGSIKKRKSNSEVKILNRQLDYGRTPIKLNAVDISTVKLITKNISSPMEKCSAVISSKDIECDYSIESNNNFTPRRGVVCDVDKAEQERKDLELALRVEAEWNAGYALRRAPAKRRLPLPPHPLMVARNKKIQV